MATAIKVSSQDVGDGELVVSDVTFSDSYPFLGEEINGRELGLRVGSRIDSVEAVPLGGRNLVWVQDPDGATHKGRLKLLDERLPRDFMLTRPELGIAADPTQIQVGDALNNGFTASRAGTVDEVAGQDIAFGGAGDDIAADPDVVREAIFTIQVDAAGTISLSKGMDADEGEAVPGLVSPDNAVIGYCRIRVAAGAVDFDATTDDLDAAHLTTEFFQWDGEVAPGTDLSGLTLRVTTKGR